MEFRILGPLEVRDGVGVTPLPRRRERALLAALLLRPGEIVSTDRLVEAIWGESPPRTVVGSLQNAVSELRKVIGADAVATRSPGYVLTIDPGTIDAVRFEREIQRAAGLDAPERAETLAAALALWRGPALADLADEPFARNEAARLDELRLAATEERIAADLELGRGADLVAELEAHVAASPLRERLRGQLMLALYRSGRQAEALEAYQDARRALVDGLGIDPSPTLQELERRVLRQDPELLASEQGPTVERPVVGDVPVRKTITVLAATLDDVSEIDPEPLRARIDRFLTAVADVAGRHGGTLDRFLGAEAVAVFGVPRSHEDDALRAARAAVELREALAAEGDAVRVGIATGEALVGAADVPVVGDVVGIAAALRDAAPRGSVLTSEATYSLARDAVVAGNPLGVGPRRLLARSLDAVRGAHGRARKLDTPFVGRDAELAELREALGSATASGRCVAVTVLGDAGIGKTRLAEELAGSLMRGRVLGALCAPHGEGAAFLPIVDLVQHAAGAATEKAVARLLPDDENGRLAARNLAALADPTATVPRGEAFWSVRLMLETVADEDPLVVVLDDVHWAEPALLDLVEYLVERVRAAVLLVCLARPELLDERPGWAGAASDVSLVRLGPLATHEAEVLVDAMGGEAIGERVRRRLVARGEGNALHLEQLHAFVTDEGGDPSLDAVPPTVEAVLASRIDLLGAETRDALQRAAVAGPHPTRSLVVELSEPGAPVDVALLELTRRGLLHPERSEARDDAYRFHHALLRDVAYGSLPKAVRAVLHERAAAWLDRDGPGLDELVGWHLEQAHGYRFELRPDDSEVPLLARAAGERLGEAGLRAWWASDVPSALQLLERALRLVPSGTARRGELLCELGLALYVAHRSSEAAGAFAEALLDAEASGTTTIAARARLEAALVDLDLGQVTVADVERERVAAMPTFEAASDHRGLGRAFVALAVISNNACDYGTMEEAARHAVAHYRLAGVNSLGGLSSQATALYHGPVPSSEAVRRCGELVAQAEDRGSRAGPLSAISSLRALQGRFEEAQEASDDARKIWKDVSMERALETAWAQRRSTLEWLRGDLPASEAILTDSLQALLQRGETPHVATVALRAARIQIARGDLDRAAASVDLASQADHPGDVLVHILLGSTRGRLSAQDGRMDAALELARDAVAAARRTQAPLEQAAALMSLAEVELLAGNESAAYGAVGEAHRLLEEKQAPAYASALRILFPALP